MPPLRKPAAGAPFAAPSAPSASAASGASAQEWGPVVPRPVEPMPAYLPEAERQVATWEETLAVIDTPVDQHRITVSSLKGGVAKTTTVLGLGTALALHRRDQVSAIDANPARGNLAERLGVEHQRTVRDLLNNLNTIRTSSHFRRYTSVARSRFEVLASERDPVKQSAFSAQEYAAALRTMLTFRPLVITDTGTDLLLPLMREVYATTDSLVVPTTTASDSWRLAMETLAWWERHARNGAELVRKAIVPLSRVHTFVPAEGLKGRALKRARQQFEADCEAREQEMVAALSQRVRAVVVIPHDPMLRQGAQFVWDDLQPETQDAFIEIAYEVAHNFS